MVTLLTHATTYANSEKFIDINITLKQTMHRYDQTTLTNKISLTPSKYWTVITDSQAITSITSPPPQSSPTSIAIHHFLVLINLSKADNKKADLRFLILNQEGSTYSIDEPHLIVNYNQKGEIKIQEQNKEIHLTVIAKKQPLS